MSASTTPYDEKTETNPYRVIAHLRRERDEAVRGRATWAYRAGTLTGLLMKLPPEVLATLDLPDWVSNGEDVP